MKYSEAFSLLKDIQSFIKRESLILKGIDNVAGNKDLQLAMLQNAEDAKQKARRLANYILDEKDDDLAKNFIEDHDYLVELEHLVKTEKFITAKVPIPLPEELTPSQRELYAMVKPFCVDKENMGVNIGLEFKACLFSIEAIMRDVRDCLFGHDEDTTDSKNDLPKELNTEIARKYFARAINIGYIRKEGNGYKWLFGGNRGQARLGYFCNKAFEQPRPVNKLESLFNVKKLSASITNAEYEAKREDVKSWRNEMDNNIFYD